jgi:hypothetical protein
MSDELSGTRCLKRHPALVSLSRDHHFALMHALALTRSQGALPRARREVALAFLAFYDEELIGHMADEEDVVLKVVPPQVSMLAERLVDEHRVLREHAARLRAALAGDGEWESLLLELGRRLHDHVRFEERIFFEELQRRLEPDALDALGTRLESHRELRGRRAGCALPHFAKTKID